jgi:hypothetical protein
VSESGWTLVTGPEFRAWRAGLSPKDSKTVTATLLDLLGSGDKPPKSLVKKIKSSRFDELHELRGVGSHHRILFAVTGPRRGALLLGGDKTGAWDQWYVDNVPLADRICDRYLHTKGGSSQWRGLTIGSRSTTLSR